MCNHDDTWTKIKELTNYLEEDAEIGTAWVRVKQSTSQKFAQQAEERKKTVDKTRIPPEYMKYRTVFEKKDSEQLPKHQPWDHKIETMPGFKMKPIKAYEIPPKLEPTFDEWLKDNLRKGYI